MEIDDEDVYIRSDLNCYGVIEFEGDRMEFVNRGGTIRFIDDSVLRFTSVGSKTG